MIQSKFGPQRHVLLNDSKNEGLSDVHRDGESFGSLASEEGGQSPSHLVSGKVT